MIDKAIVFFLVFFSISSLVKAEKIEKKTILSSIQKKEYSPDVRDSGKYATSWSCWAWNSKGWKVQLVFFITRMHSLIGVRAGVQISVHLPNGKMVHHFVEVKKKNFKYAPLGIDIRFHDNFWKGDRNQGWIQVKVKEVSVVLNYKRLLPSSRTFHGKLLWGKNSFLGVMMAPKASIHGSIVLGKETTSFQGVGFADFSHQGAPHDLAKRWYTMRSFGKEYSFFLSHLLSAKGLKPSSMVDLQIAFRGKWLKWKKDSIVTFSTRGRWKDPQNKYEIPTSVYLMGRLEDNSLVTLKVDKKKTYHRLDSLKHVSRFVSFFIRRWVADPFLYRQEVLVSFTRQIGTKKDEIQTKGITEISLLNR